MCDNGGQYNEYIMHTATDHPYTHLSLHQTLYFYKQQNANPVFSTKLNSTSNLTSYVLVWRKRTQNMDQLYYPITNHHPSTPR